MSGPGERDLQVKPYFAFYNLTLEIKQQPLCHILSVKVITEPSPGSRGREIDSPSDREWQRLEEHMGPEILMWSFLETQSSADPHIQFVYR